MTDWDHEIEGVISDIQARQVNAVDVQTLRRVQEGITRLRQFIHGDLEMAHRDPRKAAATKQNWDSYGGLPTTEAAIRTAENAVWVPLTKGGLMLEIIHSDGEASIDIDADGRIMGVCFERPIKKPHA